MLPSVTIMIPTFNQAHCVHKAIESALVQNYPNLEVVVADDYSTDHTEKIVKKYLGDKRLKYFKNATNIGRVKNYKKALEDYATGEWVVNCDGDDYYISDRFISETINRILERNDEDIVFAQAGHQVLFQSNKKKSFNALPNIAQKVQLFPKNKYLLAFHKIAHFSHMTTLYRRDIATSIDFYRCNISSTDMESFLRLSLCGSVLLLKKVYGAWVQHEHNFSRNLNFEHKKENILYITGSYQSALQSLNNNQLNAWKKELLIDYFKNWLSRTAKDRTPFFQRVKELIRILKFAWFHHREVYISFNLFKTLISLPYKLT